MGRETKRYGIVDIGSNTVHAVVYEVREGGSRIKLMNRKDATGLINYISRNRMRKSGIERLQQLISEFKGLFGLLGCDETDYFATSSLRSIENGEAVIDSVFAATGVRIRIIDGAKEAWYDYVSFARNTGLESFVGADMGGGSVQLVAAEGGRLVSHASMECGCLRLYRGFVSGILPTEREEKAVRKHVEALCDKIMGNGEYRTDTLYFMGGTSRAASKYLKNADKLVVNTRSFHFTPEDLRRIMRDIRCDRDSSVELMASLFPERISTFVPGLIAMLVLCERTGAGSICVLKDGVREGVLFEKLAGDTGRRKR